MALIYLDSSGLAESSGTLTVYNFDSVTGEYTGNSDEYLMKGVGIPAYACSIAPPSTIEGYVTVYNNNTWNIIADHRGETVYSTSTGEASIFTNLGDYPENITPLAPATAYDTWTGSAWTTDTTAQHAAEVAKAEKQKDSLQTNAESSISLLQTKLLAGRTLTTSESNYLNAVLDYIDALVAVDTSGAPDINWPVLPEQGSS
ncbi:tail fiber assembly protein [Pantoea sp. CCBC3-3-1]|uniref:tail fiber assembly protein n=1 Tax=Pantoea sp. CCBC3-3-1 TaxID=2490851 RepID=UPI0011BDDB7A|nr:tail fiber assembly protein [Pantoea sp. CCBC3-3-1]